MCEEAKTIRDSLISPSQSDRAAVGLALAMHPGSFSATLEFLTASCCSPLKWALITKNVVRRYVLSI